MAKEFSGYLLQGGKKILIDSASVELGINSIPMASANAVTGDVQKLKIDKDALDELVNTDIRGQVCELKIFSTETTSTGGSKESSFLFTGIIDAVSPSFNRGSIGFSYVIKNQHYILDEIPLLYPGVGMQGANPYQNIDTHFASGDLRAMTEFGFLTAGNAGKTLDNPVDEYFRVLKAALTIFDDAAKLDDFFVRTINPDFTDNGTDKQFVDFVSSSKYKESITKAKELLEGADTSATKNINPAIFATWKNTAEFVKAIIESSSSGESIFQNMVAMMSRLLCNVIVGNDKIFIIPKAGSLRGSIDTNRFDQFSGISVNDPGFKPLGAVFLLAPLEQTGALLGPRKNIYAASYTPTLEDKFYSPTAVFVPPPEFITAVTPTYTGGSSDNPDNNSCSDPANITPVTPDFDAAKSGEKKGKIISVRALAEANSIDITNILNDYAKSIFNDIKVAEKTCSISLSFTPEATPGATGSAAPGGDFSPGYRFFISGVRHTFAKSSQGGGATTYILGSYAFLADDSGKGIGQVELDSLPFYGYDSSLQTAFSGKYTASYSVS